MISKDYFKREVRERFNEFVSNLNSEYAKTNSGIFAKWLYSALSDFRNWIEAGWIYNRISQKEYRHYRYLYDMMRSRANIELDKLG